MPLRRARAVWGSSRSVLVPQLVAPGSRGREELDAWAARLADAAVACSPIAAANSVPGAAVLVFRDPDNIQLELFAEPPS